MVGSETPYRLVLYKCAGTHQQPVESHTQLTSSSFLFIAPCCLCPSSMAVCGGREGGGWRVEGWMERESLEEEMEAFSRTVQIKVRDHATNGRRKVMQK